MRGSTTKELLPDERWVFIGLLCLAGDSPFDGFIAIAPGLGYSDSQLAKLTVVDDALWKRAKKRLLKSEKIKVLEHNVIKIINWKIYQSEYQRQKPYREGHKQLTIQGTLEECNFPCNLKLPEDSSNEKLSVDRDRDSINKSLSSLSFKDKNLKGEEKEAWISLRQKIETLFKKNGHDFPSPTIDYITTISVFDFPEIPHLEELKKKIAWWINHPLTKTSNIALQVRNWYSNAVDFYRERNQEHHVGKNMKDFKINYEAQKKAESIVLPSFAERIKEAEKNPDKSFLTKLLIEREKDIQSKKKQILEAENPI
jgi:hypothetical protein